MLKSVKPDLFFPDANSSGKSVSPPVVRVVLNSDEAENIGVKLVAGVRRFYRTEK